ncbi:uncharacterized protein N7496_008826 [Penicillium cataractarum]|uniref:Ubiquitin carboxyl-terminal hydrolase 19 n=1 Tax=Penicillium cataractarum TaxID=2100454 RepID=A0A9W9RZE3_9EURO|nr:uncharacterized protein N7496_008826 [Penicillium cataractarum]KAJ5369066.1 hypothetical protein N7496_008826 [Penicillium cataractarum]
MDAQYPFASRDDIWRVVNDLKDLHEAQAYQGDRITRLERNQEDNARMKSIWGTSPSPIHTGIGGSIPTESAPNSPPEPFKGFDQGHQHTMTSSAIGGFDGDDEPRRGASRANSVRFDESAILGSYGQANRSSTELPLRTGSGLGSHPMIERSLSHQSDGRRCSSGLSLYSTRTNSLRLDTSSRLMGSSYEWSLAPPPGLFLLGPVPAIIRCWLTTNFSNETLLYAAICSGSFVSSLGSGLVRKLGLEDKVVRDGDDRPSIKLALYLPEASIQQSSSRSDSPTPHLPAVTVCFFVRETNPEDETIEIVLGSDVLRSHNADILFSQDRLMLVDDERNRVSIPLVRPEKDWVYKFLHTAADASHPEYPQKALVTKQGAVGVIGEPARPAQQSISAPASTRVSVGEADEGKKPRLQETGTSAVVVAQATAATPAGPSSAKSEAGDVWRSWRREPKPESNAGTKAKPRTMTVLKPTKSMTRVSSGAGAGTGGGQSGVRSPSEGSVNSPAPNPVGGASAFGWLNTTTTTAK